MTNLRLRSVLALTVALYALTATAVCAEPPRQADPLATLGTIDIAGERRARRPVSVPSAEAPVLSEEETVARVLPLGEPDGAPAPVIGMGAFNAAPVQRVMLPQPVKAPAPEGSALPIPPIEPHSPAVEFYTPADSDKPTQPIPVPLVEEQELPALPEAPAPAPVAVAEVAEAKPVPAVKPAPPSPDEVAAPAQVASYGTTRQISDLELWRVSLEGVNRPARSLSQQSGKLTVIHFWADWCAPCMEELPQLQAFYRDAYPELERAGLRLVTISNDPRASDAEKAIRQYGLTFPVFLDGRQKVNRDLARTRALPLTVIVDENGSVDILSVGKFEWTAEAFEVLLADGRNSS